MELKIGLVYKRDFLYSILTDNFDEKSKFRFILEITDGHKYFTKWKLISDL